MIQINVTKALYIIIPALTLAAGYFLPWFILLAIAIACLFLIRWILSGPRGCGAAGGLADQARVSLVFMVCCLLALLLIGKVAGIASGFDPAAWWLTLLRRLVA